MIFVQFSRCLSTDSLIIIGLLLHFVFLYAVSFT